MQNLSLRLRVFLFFCLIALGGIAVISVGLWLGYRQFGAPEALSAFITSGIVAAMGVTGLSVFVWLLFDENVSKPIESLSAGLRVRANADMDAQLGVEAAKYLGDLAPAATEIQRKLGEVSTATEETVRQQTERITRERGQLLQILSDLPIATIVARADHQIVLYDGQAADLMERECPARLGGSVFDYLHEASVRAVLADMAGKGDERRDISIKGLSGAVYSGHIRRFGAEIGYTLMLEPLNPDASRPLVYDFDLFEKDVSADLEETALCDLTFTVFDSETTGLDPERDDVVQLGAVRIVNGRLIEAESFDTLVDPGCPIPPASTKIHRIDDAMVAGAPNFASACRDFSKFAAGSVMVAHNAAFDMAFLHRQAASGGVPFDHAIIDTVHLSAIVFGGSSEHTLDALSQRLNIDIPDDLRHSALGDAVATARVLVALLPILEARGLHTFRQLQDEMRKHNRILKLQE